MQFHFNGSYPKKKNWALDNLPFRNEWVLIVDADEVVVPELADEIARRTAADEADGFYLNMKYYFLGRRIKHCGYAEAWNLRLFKHRLGRYERMPVRPGSRPATTRRTSTSSFEGKALRLVHELDHHAYPTIAAWVEKHNRYAVWEAEMYERFLREPIPTSIGPGKRFKRRLKKVYLRLPFRPLVRFLYSYVVRLGFLDGKPGLVFCTLLAFYDFLAWANVYERRVTKAGADGPEADVRRSTAGVTRSSRPRRPSTRLAESRAADGVDLGVNDAAVDLGEEAGLGVGVVVAADRVRGPRSRGGGRGRGRPGVRGSSGPGRRSRRGGRGGRLRRGPPGRGGPRCPRRPTGRRRPGPSPASGRP